MRQRGQGASLAWEIRGNVSRKQWLNSTGGRRVCGTADRGRLGRTEEKVALQGVLKDKRKP